MAFSNIYKNKKVIITGNTGFKGTWLSTWLKMMGAEVYGVCRQLHRCLIHFILKIRYVNTMVILETKGNLMILCRK